MIIWACPFATLQVGLSVSYLASLRAFHGIYPELFVEGIPHANNLSLKSRALSRNINIFYCDNC